MPNSTEPEIFISMVSLVLSGMAVMWSFLAGKRSHRTSFQPVLIFSNGPDAKKNNKLWYVENVGNGPALNVILAAGDINRKLDEKNVVILPGLSSGDKHSMKWIEVKGTLIATYMDAYQRQYTTICTGNQNTFAEQNLYPKLKPTTPLHKLPGDIEIALESGDADRP